MAHLGTKHPVRNEPDEPDTAAIIDLSERLLAESRALLDDMSQQLEGDIDLTSAPVEAAEQQQQGSAPPPS